MQYDYNSLKKRIEPFRDELMGVIFNPNRIEYFLYKYNYNLYNEEYVEFAPSEECYDDDEEYQAYGPDAWRF